MTRPNRPRALGGLNDCGLRSQEAADLQIRDVDIAGAQITVRAGKGRKARRVPIVGESIRRLEAYLAVRCVDGLPPIGSDREREAFLIGQRADQPGQPWRPGMTTAAQRKRFAELRRAAAEKLRAGEKRRQPGADRGVARPGARACGGQPAPAAPRPSLPAAGEWRDAGVCPRPSWATDASAPR